MTVLESFSFLFLAFFEVLPPIIRQLAIPTTIAGDYSFGGFRDSNKIHDNVIKHGLEIQEHCGKLLFSYIPHCLAYVELIVSPFIESAFLTFSLISFAISVFDLVH